MRQRPKGLPRKRGGTGDYKGAALILLLIAYPGVVAKISLLQTLFIHREHKILNPDSTKLSDFL
jgi:hypothetical protein